MEQYQENSRRTQRVKDAQLIIGHLASLPIDIGVDCEGKAYQPSPYLIPDTQEGYDSEGNYHAYSLRTEHLDKGE